MAVIDTQNLYIDFKRLISPYPEAEKLIQQLEKTGELLLFGGVVREYIDNRFQRLPRDFDIVVNKANQGTDLDSVLIDFDFKKNRFDGYKITVDNLEFDIWEIQNTWAFKENKINCSKKDYPYNLPETVFLNIDSLAYNLNKREFYGDRYRNAMNEKILDVVLYDNPFKELNLLRSIIFKIKYQLNYSKKLVQIIREYICEENNYLNELYKVQFTHYHCEKITKSRLDYEIKSIL